MFQDVQSSSKRKLASSEGRVYLQKQTGWSVRLRHRMRGLGCRSQDLKLLIPDFVWTLECVHEGQNNHLLGFHAEERVQMLLFTFF